MCTFKNYIHTLIPMFRANTIIYTYSTYIHTYIMDLFFCTSALAIPVDMMAAWLVVSRRVARKVTSTSPPRAMQPWLKAASIIAAPDPHIQSTTT